MEHEAITTDLCQSFREKLYTMIFPRWALIILGSVIFGLIYILYAGNTTSASVAAEAMDKAKDNDTKFTLKIEHTNQGLTRLEGQFAEQQKLLIKIDKKIPDNGD